MHDLKKNPIPTLAELLEEYLKTRRLRPRTEAAYRSILARCCPDWLELPVTDIATEMILRRHRYLSQSTPTQANYCMRIIRALFSFGLAYCEDRDGKPVLVSNPVQKLTATKGWNKKRSRIKEFIPAESIGRWWQAVHQLENETMRDYLVCLLLTGLRASELGGLPWTCVDLVGGFITITPDRSKNHKLHRIPLSSHVLNILKRRRQTVESQYVFPSRYDNNRHLTCPYSAVAHVVKSTGIFFRPHSLRRTYVNLMTHPAIRADESQIKTLVNHTANDPTYQYYASIHPESLRLATQRATDLVLALADQELSRIARRK